VNIQDAQVGLGGIQFFGKMAASISHEIKNVLAIINENAGLLEDICLMAERGKPIDPARLKRLSGSVKDQIRRADHIMTVMSRFAHSVDEASVSIDVSEVVELLVSLSARFVAMRGVVLEVGKPAGPVAITTCPFALLNLLWLCLDYVLTVVGPGKAIELLAEKTGDGVWFRFCKLDNMETGAAPPFPTEREIALGQALYAQILRDPAAGEVRVLLAQRRNA
jgi:C4-dicarboxylate-specific signal transduction histidine kinase